MTPKQLKIQNSQDKLLAWAEKHHPDKMQRVSDLSRALRVKFASELWVKSLAK